MQATGDPLDANEVQGEERSDRGNACNSSQQANPLCQPPGIALHGTDTSALDSRDSISSPVQQASQSAPASVDSRRPSGSFVPGLTVRGLLGMGRRMASSIVRRMFQKPPVAASTRTLSPADSAQESGPIVVDTHALEHIRDAARDYVSQTLDSLDTNDAQDPTLSAARLAGRMVGKDAYAHPHAQKLEPQTASPSTSDTSPTLGTTQRRNLRVMVRDMKDGAKAVGHTMTHLPQAASEIAGRMMGKDNYEHPGSPAPTKASSPTRQGRHGRSSSCSTVHTTTQRSSFEVINSSSSSPEVDVLLPNDLQPPALGTRTPCKVQSAVDSGAKNKID